MSGFVARLTETARLMVGLPSYDAYLRHMAEHHPDDAPMSHTAFFRNRQDARYRGGGGRCC
jgi:uncharacterized short protein YbdD (DUF466 family)